MAGFRVKTSVGLKNGKLIHSVRVMCREGDDENVVVAASFATVTEQQSLKAQLIDLIDRLA